MVGLSSQHNAREAAAARDRLSLFSAGLAQGGYVPERSVAIEYRFADNANDRLPDLAAELVRMRVVFTSPPVEH
jgi:putative tryptophan/tyrosine transport system substrate-binding protein